MEARNTSTKSWCEHVLKTTANNFRINYEPRYAFFTHPGLNYDALDIYGNPSPQSLIAFTGDFTHIAFTQPCTIDGVTRTLFNWPQLETARTYFKVATEISVSRAMYKGSVPKWPLDIKVSIGPVGTSSLRVMYESFVPGSSESIYTCREKLVAFDEITRKPKPIPDWFKEDLRGCEADVPDFKVSRLQKPAKTFVQRLKVMWSDTDERNHTNSASYIRFGMDALHLALTLRSKHKTTSADKSGAGVSSPTSSGAPEPKPGGRCGDISNSPSANNSEHPVERDTNAVKWMTLEAMKSGMKSVRICYLQECTEGDMVDTHIWQEEGEELTVKCSVEGIDGTALCQFVLEFFGPANNL